MVRKNGRKIMLFALICVIAGLALAIDPVYVSDNLGRIVQPGQTHTAQDAWITIDTTASAGDEPNDLAVTERTYATVSAAAEGGDDKISIYGDSYAEIEVLSSYNAVRFRCIGITGDGTATYQIYFGTLDQGTDCVLAKAGQLAWVVGTQASLTATYELADAVTATAGDWVKAWGTATPGSNQVAEASIDLMGADLIVVVPTTVSANCKLLMKGY